MKLWHCYALLIASVVLVLALLRYAQPVPCRAPANELDRLLCSER